MRKKRKERKSWSWQRIKALGISVAVILFVVLLLVLAAGCTVTGTQFPPTTPVKTTQVVAASDSAAGSKLQADYVCDGTEDEQEIQAAIDAITKVRGKVVLLEGTYTISDTIGLPANVTLEGQGASTIIKLATGANANAIMIPKESSNVKVTNLSIDGNKTGQTGGSIGIVVSGTDVLIENLEVKDCYWDNISVVGPAMNVTLTGVSSHGAGDEDGEKGAGLELRAHARNVTITDSQFWGNTQGGIFLSAHEDEAAPEGILVSNVHVFNNLGASASGFSTAVFEKQVSRYKDILIENSVFENNGDAGVALSRVEDATVSGSKFIGNANSIAIGGDATFSSQNILITASTFQGQVTVDLHVNDLRITGNTFIKHGLYLRSPASVVGNTFQGFTSGDKFPFMIRLDAGTDGTRIVGNTFTGEPVLHSPRAIYSPETLDSLVVESNHIMGIRSSSPPLIDRGYGIMLSSLRKSKIQSNIIEDCDVGLRIAATDKETTIGDNTLRSNDIDVYQ